MKPLGEVLTTTACGIAAVGTAVDGEIGAAVLFSVAAVTFLVSSLIAAAPIRRRNRRVDVQARIENAIRPAPAPDGIPSAFLGTPAEPDIVMRGPQGATRDRMQLVTRVAGETYEEHEARARDLGCMPMSYREWVQYPTIGSVR